MKYAVVETNGNQFKVSEGEEFLLEGELGKPGEKVEFDKVLLLVQDGKVEIGEPQVKGASLQAQILEQGKGKKLRVLKYRAKSRYRRVRGHRASYTRLKVEKIKK